MFHRRLLTLLALRCSPRDHSWTVEWTRPREEWGGPELGGGCVCVLWVEGRGPEESSTRTPLLVGPRPLSGPDVVFGQGEGKKVATKSFRETGPGVGPIDPPVWAGDVSERWNRTCLSPSFSFVRLRHDRVGSVSSGRSYTRLSLGWGGQEVGVGDGSFPVRGQW